MKKEIKPLAEKIIEDFEKSQEEMVRFKKEELPSIRPGRSNREQIK